MPPPRASQRLSGRWSPNKVSYYVPTRSELVAKRTRSLSIRIVIYRAQSHLPMASSFVPAAVRDLAVEVSTLLKERSESVCVAETVSLALAPNSTAAIR